ncbi:hypothetical protein HDU91_005681 [Kappamyces sp. JEL0680]|nr:hypothetical protein HDU91_005681 [Kappamyces sp. JEL0680]
MIKTTNEAKRGRRRVLSSFDSSSDDDEGFQKEIEALGFYATRQQEEKSLVFYLFRYPMLFISVVAIALNLTAFLVAKQLVNLSDLWHSFFSRTKGIKKRLLQAGTYKEYLEHAQLLDQSLQLDGWRKSSSPLDQELFDSSLISNITERLIRYRSAQKVSKLCWVLRDACKNDLGGIENKKLYSKTYSGTKMTIDNYVKEVCRSLDFVAESDVLSLEEKRDLFNQYAHTFGKTALALSGGAALGWFHMGLIKTLYDEGYLPSIFSGSSAGAMMSCMIATRTDEELYEIFDHATVTSNLWREEKASLWKIVQKFWRDGHLISDENFRNGWRWQTKGDMTFLEAYKKTGRVLNITVTSQEKHSKTKVCNYLNTPHVTINSAMVASCSVPGLLPPCPLFQKDMRGKIVPYNEAGRTWRDGSLRADIPHRELHQLFQVKYTIVSQVNPHISSFFFFPKGQVGKPSLHQKGWKGGFLAASVARFALLDMSKWLKWIRDLELLPLILGSNFSRLWLQSFHGSLTILYTPSLKDYQNILDPPDKQSLEEWMRKGQQSTWPALQAIKNRMRIEKRIEKHLEDVVSQMAGNGTLTQAHEQRKGIFSPPSPTAALFVNPFAI